MRPGSAPDDIEILLGLSQHTTIENVERLRRGVPMLPRGFHLERDRRFQMLAQCAGTHHPRGRRLDVAEVPSPREEGYRNSKTENVVPVLQWRRLARRVEPVQIPDPLVPQGILRGERDVRTALHFGQADVSGSSSTECPFEMLLYQDRYVSSGQTYSSSRIPR
jgi:hypothetical protein